MPELPEVETVRRSLERIYLNKKIDHTEILLERMILSPLEEFQEKTKNASFVSFGRKGKYLFLNMDNGYTIISHLRMEGKYILKHPEDPLDGHPRVIFHLTNKDRMIYDDSRSFGIMKLVKTDKVSEEKEIAKLGPEPFDIESPSYLFDIYRTKKCEIKSCLLDQEIMTGLGNIYTDEVLFKSKVNPFKKADKITIKECYDILLNAKNTLKNAIELGGSTVSSYHPEAGVDGKFQTNLLCYGKEGFSCPNCGSKMLKDKIGGRGTTYCPKCQNVCISLGVTGKIASGKSTVLKYAKDHGYQYFSCDEEVVRLYATIEVKRKLIQIFGEPVLNDNMTISKGYIKEAILAHPELKEELENYIHPLVKESIKKFIAKHKEEKIVFVEVPLMFESKSNLLVDYVLGVTCSYATQLRHLKIRGSKTISSDLMIAQSNQFDKNVAKCDFLVSNDGTMEELNNQIDQLVNSLI